MADSRRLLFAEDDPNDQLLIRRSLATAALDERADFVRDGQEAVDYLEKIGTGERGPRLVVLDLKMPRLDGIQVLEWIRARAGLERVPVVLFTSSGEPSDIGRAYAAGANAVVIKPPTLKEFTRAVSTMGSFWVEVNAPPTP